MAQRWGFGDPNCHLWAATGLIYPQQWSIAFGGMARCPVEAIIVYRELLTTGCAEIDLANKIVAMTPESERSKIVGFWFGSESLTRNVAKRGANTVEEIIGSVLRRHNLPTPIPADENRVDGWRFLYNCLRQASLCQLPVVTEEQAAHGPMLLIGAQCSDVIEYLPLAVRNEKAANDVDERPAEKWAAVADAVRYLVKSKPSAQTEAPRDVRRQMLAESISDPTSRHMAMLAFRDREARKANARRAPYWRTGS